MAFRCELNFGMYVEIAFVLNCHACVIVKIIGRKQAVK